MKRIIIIGGGIAGLAAAHRLLELRDTAGSQLEILLLEASHRLGGCIATERFRDFVVEAGPDSFISEKPAALRLCERLGLRDRLLSTQPEYQKIEVVHRGRLVALPEGFLLVAPTRLRSFLKTPLFSWAGKLRIATELFRPRLESDDDESLGAFVRRRFGAETLERIAQPLIGGIYASDPEKLSLAASMPRFKEMEKNKRSIIKAMWSEQRRRAHGADAGSGARWSLFVTLVDGMQELVDALARCLPEASIRVASPVRGILRDEDKNSWTIHIDRGQSLTADAIILATPAFCTAALLTEIAPKAANGLNAVSYASTVTVSLGYRSNDFPKPPSSFGFVVPAIERRKIMACTFSSLKYPGRAPTGRMLLRTFLGGSLQAELFQDDDATVERNVRAELANLLGLTAKPLFVRIWRHPNSMPQYHLGHLERIRRVESALDHFSTLALAGSAYHGVGISDCIRSGEEAAEKILRHLQSNRTICA